MSGLTGLRNLNLEDNQLSTLPADIFADLTGLNYLTLTDNQLTTLPAGIFEGPSDLWDLYLDGNRFTTLPDRNLQKRKRGIGFFCAENDFIFKTIQSILCALPYRWKRLEGMRLKQSPPQVHPLILCYRLASPTGASALARRQSQSPKVRVESGNPHRDAPPRHKRCCHRRYRDSAESTPEVIRATHSTHLLTYHWKLSVLERFRTNPLYSPRVIALRALVVENTASDHKHRYCDYRHGCG